MFWPWLRWASGYMWPTVGRAASTIRAARVIKIAARVVEMKTQIRLHLPTSCPDQRILRIVLDRTRGS
ncbi:transposase [Shinella sp. HY16]|nr:MULTISPECIES: hypothetical protein [unclassified Shinella]MDC7264651.1 transposase [Shinella sp. HY16]